MLLCVVELLWGCCVLLSADELCGSELLSVDELSVLLSELDEFSAELDELLEDELVELDDELSDVLSSEFSEKTIELSETLSVPLISPCEGIFPAQPVHSSITDKINAADLVISFFMIRSFDKA